MRFFLLLLATLTFARPAQAAERGYAITDFDRVIVEGPYTVRLTVGRPGSASASGSPRALDAVSVDVQGMTLRIRPNRNAWGSSSGSVPEAAVITLTTRNLRAARVIGAGSIVVSGATGLRVDLSVEGSGSLAATAIQADALWLALRGTGSLSVAGRAGNATLDAQGSGPIAAQGLTAENATVAAATSGNIALTVRRAVTVTANGLGSIVISGDPACTVRGPNAAGVRCGRAR